MAAYIARRLLLMIPTLFGIMLISFVVVQFAPGGPVERIIAQLQGQDAGATSRFGGGGGDVGASGGASQSPKGQAPPGWRGWRVADRRWCRAYSAGAATGPVSMMRALEMSSRKISIPTAMNRPKIRMKYP